MAPLARAGTWILAGLMGCGSAGALGGCTALVHFDDPPAGDDDDVDASPSGKADAAPGDATTTFLPDAADAGDTSTRPGDAAPSADAAPDAAGDGSTDLLAACPGACEGYTAGNFWVCGWKRAACIDDSADLNIVLCDDTVAQSAYTCAAGETCVGSDNEDFCDPCKGSTGPMCDPAVQDPSHPAYLVNCMGTAAPTYQTCSDVGCTTCLGAVRTATLP